MIRKEFCQKILEEVYWIINLDWKDLYYHFPSKMYALITLTLTYHLNCMSEQSRIWDLLIEHKKKLEEIMEWFKNRDAGYIDNFLLEPIKTFEEILETHVRLKKDGEKK